MAQQHIHPNHEVCEILNLFPFLSNTFDRLKIPYENIIEGTTIEQYLLYNNFSYEETLQIIKRLNQEVNLFLRKTEKIKPHL